MKEFTLYMADAPSRATNVLWGLEECGADYDVVALSFGGSMKAPEYLAINPLGKVPALKHKGAVLTETAAVLTYLAEQFPAKNLIPAVGTPERGQYYRWLCFALNLEYGAVDKWRQIENNDQQRLAIGYGDFNVDLDMLRDHLKDRSYIVGDRFSMLDLYYSGLLAWLIHGAKLVAADPVFVEYMTRHMARPAYARSGEVQARYQA